MDRKRRKLLTLRFLYRTTLFLGALSLGLVAFYYFGNMQSFLDSTQKVLLAILSVVSVALVLVAVFTVVPSLVMFFAGDRRYLLPVVMSLFLCAVGLACAALSRVIIIVSVGN